MSKAKRNREIRREAAAIKEVGDSRSTKAIARRIRRQRSRRP